MNTTNGLDHRAAAWLADGPTQLSDRALDAALREVHVTRQRRAPLAPWRFPTLPTYRGLAAAVAVAMVVGLGALRYAGDHGGLGGERTASPTVTPTPSAPTGTPRPDPEGDLRAGSYVARPLPTPADALTVTFTVPDGWAALAGATSLVPAGGPTTAGPGGMAIQFIDVTTVNGDLCDWSGTAGVTVEAGVDALVEALSSHAAYEVTGPVDVTIGGYQGKRMDIIAPTAPFVGQGAHAPACDNGVLRPWESTVHGADGVYMQGPANRWQANILDVDGTRLVVVVQDFPGTSPADRAELDAIVASLVIKP